MTTPATHTAFFYGTLMAPAVLARVTGRARDSITSSSSTNSATPKYTILQVQPAILHKHSRHRVLDADYPAVVATPDLQDSSVRGTFVSGLSDRDLNRLDLFEGDEYVRVGVEVELLAGTVETGTGAARDRGDGEGVVRAETYIWVAGRHKLDEREWDFDEFVREKMWRWARGEGDEGFKDAESGGDGTGGRAVGGWFEETVR